MTVRRILGALVITSVLMLLAVTPALAGLDVTTVGTIAESPGVYDLQMSEQLVVWEADDGIWVHDIQADTTDWIGAGNYPRVSGMYVVWLQNDGNDPEVWLYSAATQTPTQVTDNDYWESYLEISSEGIAWSAEDKPWTDDPYVDTEIFYRPVFGGPILQITDDPDGSYYDDSYVDVSGDRVTWVKSEPDTGKTAAWVHDVSDDVTRELPDRVHNTWDPEIEGDNIVYLDFDNGNDVHLYNYATQADGFLNDLDVVSTGQIVGTEGAAWISGTDDIGAYDFESHSRTVFASGDDATYASPCIAGSGVLWLSTGPGGTDVLAAETTDAQVTNFTLGNDDACEKPRIAGMRAAWLSYNEAESHYDIWLAGLESVGGDITPPATAISWNPENPGADGWFPAAPLITLTANEQGATEYKWDGSPTWTTYSTPLSAPEGEHMLYFRSTDLANNVEETKFQAFKVNTQYTYLSSHPTGEPFLRRPQDVATDGSGNIYVLDDVRGRIWKRDPAGNIIDVFGSGRGSAAGQIQYCESLAVDDLGKMYIGDSVNSRIQVWDQNGQFERWIASGPGIADGEIGSVAGLAVDRLNDKLYVADAANSRVQVFQPSSGEFNRAWTTTDTPVAVATRGDGFVYVLEENSGLVHRYMYNGEFHTWFGEPGTGEGQTDNGAAIAVDALDRVYVLDDAQQKINMYSSGTFMSSVPLPGRASYQSLTSHSGIAAGTSGLYVADRGYEIVRDLELGTMASTGTWGHDGTGDAGLIEPSAICTDGDYYYVADSGNSRIQKYDLGMQPVTRWGSPGSFPGAFGRIDAVTVDSTTGVLYTAESDTSRIQAFDCTTGQFLVQWFFAGGTGMTIAPDGDLVIASSNDSITKWDVGLVRDAQPGVNVGTIAQSGSAIGCVIDPVGLSYDAAGNLWIADSGNFRIQRFGPLGAKTAYGSIGDGDGQFRSPRAIAVDHSGDVIVADWDRCDIQVFGSGGQWKARFGAEGSRGSLFDAPSGIAASPDGRFLVSDFYGDRVQEFRPTRGLPPLGAKDSFSGRKDVVLSVPAPGVLGNDYDSDNDTLSAQLVTGPLHGDLVLNSNGSFTYTPDHKYSGPDSFSYRASDGTSQSEAVQVSIDVVGAAAWFDTWNGSMGVEDWRPNTSVDLTFEKPGGQIVSARLTTDQNGLAQYQSAGLQMQTGTMTAWSPGLSKTLAVGGTFRPLRTDIISNTVTGIAPTGQTVECIGTGSGWSLEGVAIAGGDGRWTVSFPPQDHQLAYGDTGVAMASDSDGDYQRLDWAARRAVIGAVTGDDRVWLDGWGPFAHVQVRLSSSPDPTGGTMVVQGDANVEGDAVFEGFGAVMQSGMYVHATDGAVSKSLFLDPELYVSGVDYRTDTVSGHATASKSVSVVADAEGAPSGTATANGAGMWSMQFATYDLVPGSFGWVALADSSGDVQQVPWRSEIPTVWADSSGQALGLTEWIPGTVVDVTVDLDGSSATPADEVWGQQLLIDSGGQADVTTVPVTAGTYVTATDGLVTKQLFVSALTINSADRITDVVSGTSDATNAVAVSIAGKEGEFWTDVIGGSWQTDLSSVGVDTGDLVSAEQADVDGDFTRALWETALPSISVDNAEDDCEGYDFEPNTMVVFSVLDSMGTPVGTWAGTSDSTGYVKTDETFEIDIHPGMTVTADDGTNSRELLIASVGVLSVDVGADIVRGSTAMPNDEVQVVLDSGVSRVVLSSGAGLWEADFSDSQGPQDPYDIGWDDTGYVRDQDDDGDANTSRWHADMTPPETTSSAEGVYWYSASISLSAIDAGHQVAETWWRIAPGDWVQGTTAQIATIGTHTLEYYSIDELGNQEAIRQVSFEVITPTRCEQDDALISYSPGWNPSSSSTMSGGTYNWTSASGGRATVAFEGTGIAWIASKWTMFGIARVSIDNGPWEEVDLYSPVNLPMQSIWSTTHLEQGYHTLRIEWTGKKNPAASNTRVSVDALDVAGSLRAVPTRYQQDDSRIWYSSGWTRASSANMSGGTYDWTSSPSGRVTVAFEGTGIAWIASKYAMFGIARVSLDDGPWQDVDLYSQLNKSQQTVWSAYLLEQGHHTLRLEWTGTKNPAATGSRISVDAFDIVGSPTATSSRYEQEDSRISYASGWTRAASSSMSGGTYDWTGSSGARATAAFRGSGIAWIASKYTMFGIARVSVDNGPWQDVDLYSVTNLPRQRVWSVDGLEDGNHTVVIEWTGRRNAAATNSRISVDAFDVAGELISAPIRYEQEDARISYSPGWIRTASSNMSGGTYDWASSSGATVTVSFSGNGIAWIASKSTMFGIARVSVDNGPWQDVDLYSETSLHRQSVWSVDGLEDGNHTVVIEWTGRRNVSATNSRISLDAFDIVGSLIDN